jgi:hypothetical protein
MKRVFTLGLVLVSVVFGSSARAQTVPGGACLQCHLTTEDRVGELWKDDVHQRAGITCVDCHGGDDTKADKELAKRRGTGYRGELTAREVVESCGGCHSDVEYMKERKPLLPVDQLEKYWTSRHGELLEQGEIYVYI